MKIKVGVHVTVSLMLDDKKHDSAQRQNQRHRLFVSVGNQRIS